jgi:cell division protein FtsL
MWWERDIAKFSEKVHRDKDAKQVHLSPETSNFEKVMVGLVWAIVIMMGIGMYMVKAGS